jgi:hypothetical protein
MNYFLQSGNFPNKSQWKTIVTENIKRLENSSWKEKKSGLQTVVIIQTRHSRINTQRVVYTYSKSGK